MLASPRRTSGFTLVELLVVIGIIGILISVLLPTIARARAQANVTYCQSNLRQIGIALRMYANDYRDRYPDDYTVGGAFFRRQVGTKNPADPTSLTERYGLPGVLHGINPDDPLDQALARKGKYIDYRSKVWLCPSAVDFMTDFGVTYMADLLTTKTVTSVGNWTSLQRGRLPNAGTFYVYDNFTNLPYNPGFRRGSTDPNPTIPAAQRPYPHPYKTPRARAVNMLYINGNVGIVVYPPSGNTDKNQG